MATVLQLVKNGGQEVRIGGDVGSDSNLSSWGIPLGSLWADANGSKRTAAHRVCASDGGAALAAGEYRGDISRFLITQNSALDLTLSGHVGQLKLYGASITGVGNQGGATGYLETTSGAHVGGTGVHAGVWGRVDLPSGAVIDAGATLSAFGTGYNDLGGTHTGKAAFLHIGTPAAGAWDSLAEIASGNTTIITTTAGASASKYLTVTIDGTAYKIALLAAS